MIKLSPSILSADFAALGDNIRKVENAGAHYLHIDVMDGIFVPNISLGIPVIKSIRNVTDMTFDVHLMITKPERYIKAFVDAGADIINIHLEASEDIKGSLASIKSFNKRTGLTINPNTKVEEMYPYLENLDLALIMSVNPGFGGQSFITSTLKKIEKLANYVSKNNLVLDIEVDGGITLENVNDILNAGANVIVSGSSIFSAQDIEEAVKSFYDIFKNAKK